MNLIIDSRMHAKHRSFVGEVEKYDLLGAQQFNILCFLGLRETDYLLDIGCGSLAAGRLFIPYLLPGRYFGIEPEKWLIKEGIRNELGEDIIEVKKPCFSTDPNFLFSTFKRNFDFILAHSIFTHSSQSQIDRCLSEARKVMKQTSLFVATFAKGKNNYEGNEWVYPGFVKYTFDLIEKIFQDNELICKMINWPHPSYQTWLIGKLNSENFLINQEKTELDKIQNQVSIHNDLLMENREIIMDLFLK